MAPILSFTLYRTYRVLGPAQRGGSGCGFNARIEPGLVNRLDVRGGNGCGLRPRIVPGFWMTRPGAAKAGVSVVTMAATTAVAAKAAIFQDIVMLPSTRSGLNGLVVKQLCRVQEPA